jgi:hypothetical protein
VDAHSIDAYFKSSDVIDQLQRTFKANQEHESRRALSRHRTWARSAGFNSPSKIRTDSRDPRNLPSFAGLDASIQLQRMEEFLKQVENDRRRSRESQRRSRSAQAAVKEFNQQNQPEKRKRSRSKPSEPQA